MLNDILPTLIMVTIVAIFLFLICETTISFVFYFTGFLLIVTMINLWYMTSRRYKNIEFVAGETMVTKMTREDQLY